MSVTYRFCTTEDVALKAVADFAELALGPHLVAEGKDGVLAPAGTVLSSPTVDLQIRGVASADVAVLVAGGAVKNDVLAVESVSGSGAVLRRLGRAAGVGQPAGSAAGSNAVTFRIYSLDPLIAEQTRILSRRFRVAGPESLQSPDDFRRVTVLGVLIDLFGTDHRMTGQGAEADNFAAKLRQYRDEFADEVDVLGRTYGIEHPDRSSRPRAGTIPDDPSWRVPSNF